MNFSVVYFEIVEYDCPIEAMKRRPAKTTTTKRRNSRVADRKSTNSTSDSAAVWGVLDALPAQIAILDGAGHIVAVNKAWSSFARDVAISDRAPVGVLYSEHCKSLPSQAPYSVDLSAGVQAVLAGKRSEFEVEYPLRAGGREMWFHARVTRSGSNNAGAVIAHEDISERVQLEREIVSVSAREQQRLRQELHDGLSQQLTGLKFKASLLEYHLQSKGLPEAGEAKSISELLNQATDEASKLARRFRPVEVDARGLMMALRQLSTDAEQMSEITCTVQIRRPVFIHDNNAATNLYRIAEEAVGNAVQRRARRVQVTLTEDGRLVTLKVRDNGRRIDGKNNEELGIHMMRYHARMMGGTLEWRREGAQGMAVTCCVTKPAPAADMEPVAT